MYVVGNSFKESVKSNLITSTVRLTFKNFFSNGDSLVLNENSITTDGIELLDYCYNEGKLIGTAMTKQVTCTIKNVEGYDLADKEFDLEIGVMTDRANMAYEYVPYGSYIVTSYEDLKSANKYRLKANDIMTRLNTPYHANTSFKPTYPITLKQFYKEFMLSYGIEVEEQTLPNENFEITSQLNFDGLTGRKILSNIAELFGSFVKINRNNKAQMYLKTETDEVITKSQMNSTLEIDNAYGPVNVVTIGLSSVEGENVTLEDEDSIAEHGETTIRIDDNIFAYTEELREQLIGDLFERLKGFTYVPVKCKLKCLMYSDCGDRVRFETMNEGEYVESIILNQVIKIPRTRQSSIDSGALTNTEQKNKYISQSKQAQTQTEIMVNKHEQKIQSIIENIGDRSNKKTSITQDIDGIILEVSNKMDITTEKIGIQQLMLENCMEGQLLELYIYGNNTVFEHLMPREDLYPDDLLYPYGDALLVVNGNNIREGIEPVQGRLVLDEFIDCKFDTTNENYKSLIIPIEPNEKYTVYKNAGFVFGLATFRNSPEQDSVATKFELDDFEGIGLEELEITAGEDDRYLVVYFYNGAQDVDLNEMYESIIIHNRYLELDLGIEEVLRQYEGTADEYQLVSNRAQIIRRIGVLDDGTLYKRETEKIELLPNVIIPLRKGTNHLEIKNYSAEMRAKWVEINQYTSMFTTTVELNSAITQLANQINLQVSKKVDNDEIIARINMAIQNIESDEIPEDIEKSIIEIIANKFSWKADYSEMSADGILTLRGHTTEPYVYTLNDYLTMFEYLNGRIEISDELFELYDVDNDGNIDALDYVMVYNILNGKIPSTKHANVEITLNPKSSSEFLKITLAGQTQCRIGVNEIYNYSFKGMNMFLGTYADQNNQYGILMNGEKGTIKIENQSVSTETHIDAGKVDAYNVFASSGGGKGFCMHGINEEHTYRCAWENYGNTNNFSVFVDSYKVPLIRSLDENAKQISEMTLDVSRIKFIVPNYGTYVTGEVFQSDTKLKEKISDSKVNALDEINKIRHIEFDWKKTKQALREGHEKIAYSANQLRDELGNDIAYEVKQQEGLEYDSLLQVDQSRLMPYITKAIQELSAENIKLKEEVDKQQNMINFLVEKLGYKEEMEEMINGGE